MMATPWGCPAETHFAKCWRLWDKGRAY